MSARAHRHAEYTGAMIEELLAELSDPTPATRALERLVELLEGAGVPATRDAGAFYPYPVGVLVTLPELVERGLNSRTFLVPVLVVSGEPLNSSEAVDRLYAIAELTAEALSTANYRPSSFGGSSNAEPLPALEVRVTITVEEVV